MEPVNLMVNWLYVSSESVVSCEGPENGSDFRMLW